MLYFRSMEAHARLKKKGFNVRSFGTGDKIKLPGPSLNQPNVYEFGTSYEEIHSDLARLVLKSYSLVSYFIMLFYKNGLIVIGFKTERFIFRNPFFQTERKFYQNLLLFYFKQKEF